MDHTYKMDGNSKNKFEDFASYLHGESSPDLISFNPDDKDFKAVEQIYLLKEKVNLLDRLTRIEDVRKKIETRLKRRKSSIRSYKLMKYAAVSLILLGLSGVIWEMISSSSRSESETKITTVASSIGEIKEIVAPDGTKIWLGSSSTLEFSSDFGKQNRKVILSGEAMFDVTKDQTHPFSVAVEDACIRVHGTRFILTSVSVSAVPIDRVSGFFLPRFNGLFCRPAIG